MMQKNQKGVSLLETILVLAIIGVIASGIALLISKQIRNIKNELTYVKVSKVMDASKNYVKDNFMDIQKRVLSAGATDTNGDGKISYDEYTTTGSERITSNTLVNKGYLSGAYVDTSGEINTSWGSEIKVAVAFAGNKNIAMVIALNTEDSDILRVDQVDIAAGIYDGDGAVWSDNADECTTTPCLKSIFDKWEINNITSIIPASVLTKDPLTDTAAAAVSFINKNSSTKGSVYRYPVGGNLDMNSTNSDLNMQTNKDPGVSTDSLGNNNNKARTIFFNALTNEDIDGDGLNDFTGDGLTYQQQFDSSGNPISKAVLSVNNNASGEAPYFSAQDGIITGRQATEGSSCDLDSTDIYSDFGLIATDGTNLLKCVQKNGSNRWARIGDVDYVHWLTNPIRTTANTTQNINHDMNISTDAVLPEIASSVIVQIKGRLIGAATREILFAIKNPVLDEYKYLLKIYPTGPAAGNHDFSAQGIFPFKRKKGLQYIWTSPAGAGTFVIDQFEIVGWIE